MYARSIGNDIQPIWFSEDPVGGSSVGDRIETRRKTPASFRVAIAFDRIVLVSPLSSPRESRSSLKYRTSHASGGGWYGAISWMQPQEEKRARSRNLEKEGGGLFRPGIRKTVRKYPPVILLPKHNGPGFPFKNTDCSNCDSVRLARAQRS